MNYKTFKVGDVLDCSGTPSVVKPNIEERGTIYIARTAENNGFSGYVNVDTSKIVKGNCLSCSKEGRYAFYQERPFAGGVGVYQLRNNKITELSGLYLASVLNTHAEEYNYANTRSLDRLQNEDIQLPVTLSGEPDWQYMEDYMREIMSDMSDKLDALKTSLSI